MLEKYRFLKIFLLFSIMIGFIALSVNYSLAYPFSDDMESGGSNWIADPPWSFTTSDVFIQTPA